MLALREPRLELLSSSSSVAWGLAGLGILLLERVEGAREDAGDHVAANRTMVRLVPELHHEVLRKVCDLLAGARAGKLARLRQRALTNTEQLDIPLYSWPLSAGN